VDAETCEELFERLARIDEIDMRVGLLRERLLSHEPAEGLELIAAAHTGAARGQSLAQDVLLALGWAVLDRRLTKRRIMLGIEAREQGLDLLSAFLLPPPEQDSSDRQRRVPDFGRSRPLTLGERKSLARTHDRQLIQRVVRDPHPDVVRILLNNPSLTEPDVVRICAMRPNDPGVLLAVYRHRRWVVRYRPRNAIVRNPDAPTDVAQLLVPLLRTADLREAAMASGLEAAVRLACRAVLELRESRGSREPG